IFARDQWHCRICGDRFQYSEAVRKHVARMRTTKTCRRVCTNTSGAQFGSERKSHDLAAKAYRRPEIADSSALNSTTMRSDRGFASLWPAPVIRSPRRASDGLACAHSGDRVIPLSVGLAVQPTVGLLLCKASAKAD